MDNCKTKKCSDRITEALNLRNMKQSDLCDRTKIPKSAISQYISGAFEPKQDRLMLIAQALNVDPVWLMGFDVPMERTEIKENSSDKPELTEGEKVMLDLFKQVPQDKQKIVIEMIRAALNSSNNQ